jgi:hypothetical protein
MTGIDILALAVPALLVLLGGYLVFQARRSRESELKYNLRRYRTALEDTERALENTVTYYKAEIRRLKTQLGEPDTDERETEGQAMPPRANGRANGGPVQIGPDLKFKQARTAFARLYHPDRHHGDADEKRLRAELFKEFWEELERIDRRYP